eukprot:Trichotokara_eunicae@DN3344_c0_g1_i6.p1
MADLVQKEETEAKAISKNKRQQEGPKKLTRLEISQRLAKTQAEAMAKKIAEDAVADETYINPNRIIKDELSEAALQGVEVLSNVDSVVAGLALPGQGDPEKKRKAIWKAYEADNLQLLREEFPTLKRSQLLDKLQKMWMKAPENPANER